MWYAWGPSLIPKSSTSENDLNQANFELCRLTHERSVCDFHRNLNTRNLDCPHLDQTGPVLAQTLYTGMATLIDVAVTSKVSLCAGASGETKKGRKRRSPDWGLVLWPQFQDKPSAAILL